MFFQIVTKVNLRAQFTWLSASLIIITTLILATNYGLRTTNSIKQNLQQQIHFAQNVLQQNLKQQEQVLITSANVLAADFGFKQAVATQDTGTIQSVLSNHGRRIDADLMILLNVDGQFIASNEQTQYAPEIIKTLIEELPIKENHAQIIALEKDVYQAIIVPVKAPRVIGYTIIGFQFDQNALLKLKELLSLDISFIKKDSILQSSLSKTVLLENSKQLYQESELRILFSTETFYHQTIGLTDTLGVDAVLSASLNAAQEDVQQSILETILATLVVLFFAIGLSRLLAERLTKPLKHLLNLTKNISHGNFTVPESASNFSPELGKLYHGFEVMGAAIKQRESKIVYQAEHDLLTGLYNRQKILSEVAEQLATKNNIALISFNIKGFKALNDTIGASNGDLILQEIAKRLLMFNKSLKQFERVLLSRTHADEFLVALKIHASEQLPDVVAHLRTELERPFWLNGINLALHYYYGIANSIEHGIDAEKLIRRATLAAANAIKFQQTFRYYQNGEDEAYLSKLNLIEELKQALEQEDSPLFLNFQPKLNLSNGKVDKAEALIRWINKQGEFVNPEVFIELAEQSGLIVVLTQWVIVETVKQVNCWNNQGYHFNVSINLSAQDIQHESFVNFLLDATNKFEVKSSQIILELTERDIADNEALVNSRLTHLKALGFEISVDDYGIGQSSLAKLKSLPVDELKIDKCFILKLDESQQDQDIVASTIELGHKLGLRVVAEGVENQASLTLLEQFGCDYVQGYYLSRPQKAEQLLQWYNDYVSNN